VTRKIFEKGLDMRIPTIHLNGTGAKTLSSELETAYRALCAAIDAVQAITVHGRDYYLQNPADGSTHGAYTEARDEMDARLLALYGVRDELLTMYTEIVESVR
jgi:hypothetical protein